MLVPSGWAVTDDSPAVGTCPSTSLTILTSMANCTATCPARSTGAGRRLRRRFRRLAFWLWRRHPPTIHILWPSRRLTAPSVWTASGRPTSWLTGGRHCVVPRLSEHRENRNVGNNGNSDSINLMLNYMSLSMLYIPIEVADNIYIYIYIYIYISMYLYIYIYLSGDETKPLHGSSDMNANTKRCQWLARQLARRRS